VASATGTAAEPPAGAAAAPARIAVLLSGRGSNYRALQEAVDAGGIPGRIVLVVSNVPGAGGLEAAAAAGVATEVIPHRGEPDREAHEQKVLAALDRARVEWVCLAGYMRLLSTRFVERYRWRILNIHPSLLPSFPGLEVHRQALDYGVRISGCTVHLVDAGLDSGPIVVQRAVPVLDDDTPASLAARILVEEHRAYPEALGRLLREPWRLDGRRVRFGA
jgi:phosphoribosylglycinamide formyltransferase 1